MGAAGQHLHGGGLIAPHLKLHHFVTANFALLDQPVAGNHNKKFPLGVVPVLALGNAGLGNVHAELAAVFGFQQLGKAAALVCVDF